MQNNCKKSPNMLPDDFPMSLFCILNDFHEWIKIVQKSKNLGVHELQGSWNVQPLFLAPITLLFVQAPRAAYMGPKSGVYLGKKHGKLIT